MSTQCRAGHWRRNGLAAVGLLVAGCFLSPALAGDTPNEVAIPAGAAALLVDALPWPRPGRTFDRRQGEMTAFFEGSTPAEPTVPLFGRGRRSHDIWFTPLPLRNVFFAGYDISGADHFASVGLKRALGSTLDIPGYRFLGSLGVKIGSRDAITGDRVTRLHAVRATLGREFHLGDTAITLYAGTSFIMNPDGAVLAGTRRGRFGPVTMLDLWHNWPDGVFGSRYSSAFVMADQASRSFYLRLRHGFAIGDQPWRIGPEASLSSGRTLRSKGIRVQDGWNRKRLGLHVSEIALWDARLSVSAGGEWRERGGTAFYAQAGLYFRY